MAQCQFGGGGECENDASYKVLPISHNDSTAYQIIHEAESAACDDHLGLVATVAMALATEEMPLEDGECTRVILERLPDDD